MSNLYKDLLQTEWQGATRALGMALGCTVSFNAPEPESVTDVSAWLASHATELTGMWMAIGEYSAGPKNPRTLLLPVSALRPLADMMLGGDTSANQAEDAPLTELQLGALGEGVNQLFTGSANALSDTYGISLDVGNPTLAEMDADVIDGCHPASEADPVLIASAELTIESGANFSFTVYWLTCNSDFDKLGAGGAPQAGTQADAPASAPATDDVFANIIFPEDSESVPATAAKAPEATPAPEPAAAKAAVNVRPVAFGSFDNQLTTSGEENQNLGLLMDVQLNLAVELGKTDLPIRDVLALTRGSVIELARVAGEPVDLLANGRLIAKGEVVVIEDNFGLRITSIVSPAERLQTL
ncbi:MAG: flagellar motor switch protein FliN [Vampirovibrionales bacterium]|nr:flagellar motor switch protein FliN [Vampirovibrionales bacterium]